MTARVAAMLAALLAVGFLTACGGSAQHQASDSGDEQSSEAADHNADDIAFARNMIAYHEQAVEMAQMVPTNTTNQQVVSLANKIITTQVPEIHAFRAWLMQLEDAQGNDPAGHDSHGTVAGAVEQATLDKLQRLTGTEFDRLWLTSMIDHHRGGISMAQDELADGHNPDVLYLARSVIASQQAEIDQMKPIMGG